MRPLFFYIEKFSLCNGDKASNLLWYVQTKIVNQIKNYEKIIFSLNSPDIYIH